MDITKVPAMPIIATTVANAIHIGMPLFLRELMTGAHRIAIKAESRNGTIIEAAAFMPATIIIKQAMPSTIRNALPFSLREFIEPSVKCQVSSVKVKQKSNFM